MVMLFDGGGGRSTRQPSMVSRANQSSYARTTPKRPPAKVVAPKPRIASIANKASAPPPPPKIADTARAPRAEMNRYQGLAATPPRHTSPAGRGAGDSGSVGSFGVDTGGSGGSEGSGGPSVVKAPTAPVEEPKPVQLSEEDWLKGDSPFSEQVAAIQRALRDYLTEADEQSKLYDVDFNRGLESLGFRNNAWDSEDRMGAYGRGRSALMNDFASRGLLNSTDFNNSLGDFEASMQNQLGSMQESRTNFLGEAARERSRRENEAKDAESAARREALARRASNYGL